MLVRVNDSVVEKDAMEKTSATVDMNIGGTYGHCGQIAVTI